MKRFGFTMIELVFIIVILGILAAVAFPKLAPLIEDADLAKAKGDVASIRASISSARQKSLVQGSSAYPPLLDDAGASASSNESIFDGNATNPILMYPLYAKNSSGKWRKTGLRQYTFKISTTDIAFTYYPTKTTVSGVVHSAGQFDCNHTGTTQSAIYCRHIAE